MIDIEAALNTLEGVVEGYQTKIHHTGLYYTPNVSDAERFCIVGTALTRLGATVRQLVGMGPLKIDYLYERDLCPVPLTLGGMVVFRAAQRTQDGLVGADRSWGAAFDNAVVAAGRVFDLMPDSVVSSARAELVTS